MKSITIFWLFEPYLSGLTLLFIPKQPIPPSSASCYFSPLSFYLLYPYPPPLLPARVPMCRPLATIRDFDFKPIIASALARHVRRLEAALVIGVREMKVCCLNSRPTCVSVFWFWAFLSVYSLLPDPHGLYLYFSSSLTSRVDSSGLYYIICSILRPDLPIPPIISLRTVTSPSSVLAKWSFHGPHLGIHPLHPYLSLSGFITNSFHSSTLKTEAAHFFNTSLNFKQTTRRHILEYSNRCSHLCENVRSLKNAVSCAY
jgi:hypothetical protein